MAIKGGPGPNTKFKPGISGNPKGKPKMDPELKAMRQRSRGDVEKTILKLYNFTERQLNEMLGGPELNLWEKHIARIILRGIAKGEPASFQMLSDYIFGAPPKEYKLNGQVNADVKMIPVSKKELDEAYKRAREKI